MEKNNSALFFTCSLVEFIGRETKNKRQDILNYLGKEEVSRIFKYADVFHCEPIEKVAEDFIERNYWDIGEVFERLIEDIYKEAEVIKGIFEIYQSWIADKILNFNSDLYYQSREYIAICYREGKII